MAQRGCSWVRSLWSFEEEPYPSCSLPLFLGERLRLTRPPYGLDNCVNNRVVGRRPRPECFAMRWRLPHYEPMRCVDVLNKRVRRRQCGVLGHNSQNNAKCTARRPVHPHVLQKLTQNGSAPLALRYGLCKATLELLRTPMVQRQSPAGEFNWVWRATIGPTRHHQTQVLGRGWFGTAPLLLLGTASPRDMSESAPEGDFAS